MDTPWASQLFKQSGAWREVKNAKKQGTEGFHLNDGNLKHEQVASREKLTISNAVSFLVLGSGQQPKSQGVIIGIQED